MEPMFTLINSESNFSYVNFVAERPSFITIPLPLPINLIHSAPFISFQSPKNDSLATELIVLKINAVNLTDWFIGREEFSWRGFMISRIFSSRPDRFDSFLKNMLKVSYQLHNP